MTFFGLDCFTKKERELERRLRANDREYNLSFKYATNAIKTCKYNFFTFLPLNLFEQFQRIANVYFLILLGLQLIPAISSLSWFTTVVPLFLVLTFTAGKDAIDDINRHRSDNQVNNRKVQVLIDRKLQSEKWMNVQVGDIIKLENNQFVTADLLLLSSSEPLNLVYIETAELDGETNLKVKQALPVTGDLGDNMEKLADFNGEVRCEPPNNRLDRFTGTLTFAGQKYSLNNEKILLRGCTLRNTGWCYGLVLFGGPETKLMQNCGKSTFKRTSIDRLMNVLVLCIFGFLAVMCTVLAIGNFVWELKDGSQFTVFLPRQEGTGASLSAFLAFWSYIIILNTVVPISLYVRGGEIGDKDRCPIHFCGLGISHRCPTLDTFAVTRQTVTVQVEWERSVCGGSPYDGQIAERGVKMTFFGLDCFTKKERELERRLRANDREYNLSFKYATNAIKTCKYNFFTFLPLNLFEQFQRIANVYFLILLGLQRSSLFNHAGNKRVECRVIKEVF
uniref:P-type ATPase N-terminal domain-containing protein n=1 Tax=Knipowitschia caucasica TaxID=637954 RepID=A0AAV2MP35_KNICA